MLHSNDLKKMLGLMIQVERLASDQSISKLFSSLEWGNIDGSELTEMVNATGLLKRKISYSDLKLGENYLDKHLSAGVEVLPFGDSRYPLSLAITPNPPSMLYIKGNVDILNEMPGVAIVGSRDVSPAGEEITRRVTSKVCQQGYVIISGLAIGTDTNAHTAALSSKGKTIAVLAHGLESAKPKQNARLADEILFTGGAWISEYPLGRPALKQSFVQRNRIQVGLSAVSILIEAAKGSGTMTQADFALKAARPIFAVVPHKDNNPLRLNCEGTKYLVEFELASPLRTSDDYDKLINVILDSTKKIKSYTEEYSLNIQTKLL